MLKIRLKAFCIVLFVLLFSIVVVGQSSSNLPTGVEAVQDCQNITWVENFPTVETCMKPYMGQECSDEPANQSCVEKLMHEPYPCVTGTRSVQKSRLECKTTALTFEEEFKLNIADYACEVDAGFSDYTVICDSKLDGNGDGKCTSGETCMKFVIDGTTVEKYEKNSRDDFVSSDQSFFLGRATTEVLQ